MKCENCDRDFEAVRADAQYCGTNCRSAAYRSRLRTLARAGMSVRSDEASGAKAQKAQRDDDTEEGLPVESVTSGNPDRQEQRASSSEPKEAGAKRASPQPSPARSTAPPPDSGESAAVLAMVEQLVEQRLKPLQQAYDELRAKARSQVETHEAALKKERQKRKKLRKQFQSQWWAGGGHIPGWLVPLLAAGGGGLILNLLTATDGKKIGTWLADILNSTPQTAKGNGAARESVRNLAQLLQEKFTTPKKENPPSPKRPAPAKKEAPSRGPIAETTPPAAQQSAQATDSVPPPQTPKEPEQSAGSSQKESPEASSQKESSEDSSQKESPAASSQNESPTANEVQFSFPVPIVPWTLPREAACDLLTELTGAQRQPDGVFYSEQRDRSRPLFVRLLASVEPSLVWQRQQQRASVWYYPWILYRATTSLQQLVDSIDSAAKAELPFKDKPVTATALDLVYAARELQARICSHLLRIHDEGNATHKSPPELRNAADRVERAVKSSRPAADDLLACALHDALLDLHGMIIETHDDEVYQLRTYSGVAPIENCAAVRNRHDFEARNAEIIALTPTEWAMERFWPKPPGKAESPAQSSSAAVESSG